MVVLRSELNLVEVLLARLELADEARVLEEAELIGIAQRVQSIALARILLLQGAQLALKLIDKLILLHHLLAEFLHLVHL